MQDNKLHGKPDHAEDSNYRHVLYVYLVVKDASFGDKWDEGHERAKTSRLQIKGVKEIVEQNLHKGQSDVADGVDLVG